MSAIGKRELCDRNDTGKGERQYAREQASQNEA
jgi:hypothetical protein